MKKVIVFSATNVTSGGPMTILNTFLQFANAHLSPDFDVYFLIKNKNLFRDQFDRVKLVEFPDSQKTVFHKLYYEYFYFRKVSLQLKSYVWFSLNDCSPSVESKVRIVYIHNATPFYKFTWKDFQFPSRVLLQKFYYRFFLTTNLKKNSFVVVQQNFMKDYLVNKLGYPKAGNVLIHRPVFSLRSAPIEVQLEKDVFTLIYPTKPEVYKNVHILIEAMKQIIFTLGITSIQLLLTINGKENGYSRYLVNQASSLGQVKFLGAIPFEKLMGYLKKSNLLVFPSKLETWGLPLSEGMYFQKKILAADLPYARETLKGYQNAIFFDPDSVDDLVKKIVAMYKEVGKSEMTEIPQGDKEEDTMTKMFASILKGIA